MKVVIAGGGTAGHVTPGLAVAEILLDRGDEILFIGSRRGPESRAIELAGFRFLGLDVEGRASGPAIKNVAVAFKFAKATLRCASLLARLEPSVVLGTGGYASLPVVAAAWLLRYPVVIHEQNAVAGLANRLAARLATTAAVSFEGSEMSLGRAAEVTGNPVRAEIGKADNLSREQTVDDLGLAAGRKTLLVTGGSQGAANLNKAVIGAYPSLRDEQRLQVIHLTGESNYEEVKIALQEMVRPSDTLIYKAVAYLDKMAPAYRAADLALTRAGATTVAELAIAGVPAILVPYPHSLDEDQLRNAQVIAEGGGAVVVKDADLTPEWLAHKVETLLFDDAELERMSLSMSNRAKPDAAERVAALLCQVVSQASEEVESAVTVATRGAETLSGLEVGWRQIYMLGIGGSGMSGMANVLREAGLEVSGSDRSSSPTVKLLLEAGFKVELGHEPGRLEGADVVVASAAIAESNPQLREATELGVTVVSREEMLGRILQGFRTIAVGGTHGKTTTAAITTSLLDEAGLEPTYLIGGSLPGPRLGGGLGSEWAVVEADEAYGAVLSIHPEIAVLTNVDSDHLDSYGGMKGLLEAFEKFLSRSKSVIACLDDKHAARLASKFAATTYGYSPDADIRAVDANPGAREGSFELMILGKSAGRVRLKVGGRQNIQNALAAAAVGVLAGVEVAGIVEGIESYKGVSRRFEQRQDLRGAQLFDDYAHLPAELAATLEMAGSGDWNRIVAVFQPHLYSRTQALSRELGEALAAADFVIVSDVDGAREDPVEGVTGKLVADAVSEAAPGKRVAYLPTLEEVSSYLLEVSREGDAVITLGCGDVYRVHDLVEQARHSA